MPYKLELVLIDGRKITSPIIAPNNPSHDFNSYTICNEIVKIGASIVKHDKDVVSARMITV